MSATAAAAENVLPAEHPTTTATAKSADTLTSTRDGWERIFSDKIEKIASVSEINTEDYEIISGHRRIFAAKKAGLTVIAHSHNNETVGLHRKILHKFNRRRYRA